MMITSGHVPVVITFSKDVGHGHAIAARCECGHALYAMGSSERSADKSIHVKWLAHLGKSMGQW
jgi:hypothetical protein